MFAAAAAAWRELPLDKKQVSALCYYCIAKCSFIPLQPYIDAFDQEMAAVKEARANSS